MIRTGWIALGLLASAAIVAAQETVDDRLLILLDIERALGEEAEELRETGGAAELTEPAESAAVAA